MGPQEHIAINSSADKVGIIDDGDASHGGFGIYSEHSFGYLYCILIRHEFTEPQSIGCSRYKMILTPTFPFESGLKRTQISLSLKLRCSEIIAENIIFGLGTIHTEYVFVCETNCWKIVWLEGHPDLYFLLQKL